MAMCQVNNGFFMQLNYNYIKYNKTHNGTTTAYLVIVNLLYIITCSYATAL